MEQPPYPEGAYRPLTASSPVTRVELAVSASNLKDKDILSTSDPLCVLYAKEPFQHQFYEIDRTEMVKNNLNPQWVKKFELDYRFEERQVLRFNVYDWDTKSNSTKEQDSLGYVECSLAEIMAYQGSQFRKPLSNNGGTLIINGEEQLPCKQIVTLTFSGKDLDKKDFMGKSDPFLIFYRGSVLSHQTEVVKKNLNPVWAPVQMSIATLCSGDENKIIKIECYDWDSNGKHDLIGECQTDLKTLKEGSGDQNIYTLVNPKKKDKKKHYKGSGKLILNNIGIKGEPSFLDYIRGGCQLNFTVAIDFTASNGRVDNASSLHYRHPEIDNQYIVAIKSVGEIIQDYDSDRKFPALGFGARIPPTFEVSHEFFLNGHSDSPYCDGIDGVLQAYYHSLGTVQLYGPTHFTPVIRHVMQFAKSYQDGNNYFILLIITDGIVNDLEHTKAALVEASSLPMSVIIVGVGDEDFSAMELLDGDENRLSHKGVYAERDIVQFVELRQHLKQGHQISKTLLARDVLAEIPDQFLLWMKCRNFTPNPPTVSAPASAQDL